MYSSLKQYVGRLEQCGELTRVTAKVDTKEEIAEIADRIAKRQGGGRALLFENNGTRFPLLIGMFGSERRMAAALGTDSLDSVASRIDRVVADLLSPKGSVVDKIALLPLLGEASQWFARRSKGRGECQQVVMTGDQVDLGLLPVLKCWPEDGGRFVTLPIVHTVDPVTKVPNAGMYRMQIFDRRTTALHWHTHKTGARHYELYKQLGQKVPVAVALGGDPVYTYAATAPLPDGVDEYLLAGFLRHKPVKMVRCLTNELYVPADCDFVIEGYVDPAEQKVIEGPFGDHTGFYSLEDRYPLFHVTALTHRRDAIYPATVVGIPPMEDAMLSLATEKIFLSPIRLALQPEIVSLSMPAWGVSHNFAAVAIENRYRGQANKVAQALWGVGQMMFNKYMIVASAQCDVHNPLALVELLESVDLTERLIRSEGVLDVLDHATAECGFGGKAAFDLTSTESATKGMRGRRLTVEGNRFYVTEQLIFEFDSKAAIEHLTAEELLWLGTANSDPRRDLHITDGRVVIDARTKLCTSPQMPVRFPNPTLSSAATVALVDRRWSEYGLGAAIASPSDRYRQLASRGGAAIDQTDR